MITTPKMKELYKEIQQKLFYMIPEKWDKIYLYASVMEGIHHLQTGEMFFYYFPKGILKKNYVNVYEVPNKFNLDEKEYFCLADELYGTIKKLREVFGKVNEKVWSNITISIENYKFIVEYSYEDLKSSPYNSYEHHILWRYRYLKTELNTYQKKDRKVILDYLKEQEYRKEEKKDTYVEGIYHIKVHNSIGYDREETIHNKQEVKIAMEKQIETLEKQVIQKNQILNLYNKNKIE